MGRDSKLYNMFLNQLFIVFVYSINRIRTLGLASAVRHHQLNWAIRPSDPYRPLGSLSNNPSARGSRGGQDRQRDREGENDWPERVWKYEHERREGGGVKRWTRWEVNSSH